MVYVPCYARNEKKKNREQEGQEGGSLKTHPHSHQLTDAPTQPTHQPRSKRGQAQICFPGGAPQSSIRFNYSRSTTEKGGGL